MASAIGEPAHRADLVEQRGAGDHRQRAGEAEHQRRARPFRQAPQNRQFLDDPPRREAGQQQEGTPADRPGEGEDRPGEAMAEIEIDEEQQEGVEARPARQIRPHRIGAAVATTAATSTTGVGRRRTKRVAR